MDAITALSLEQFLEKELETIRANQQYRVLHASSAQTARSITLAGQEFINFSSNDYLGLAHHPDLKRAAAAAAMDYGAGAGASRLITGNLELHELLEKDIAAWKGTESALLFNSGYHANIGAIPALASDGDIILSDALNHASLIDGCRLSTAERAVFAHNDVTALESLLKTTQRFRHRFIVTESVFSMDGDRAPLLDLLDLAERYDAWIYLDEAHATGVLGRTGAGLVEELEIAPERRERLIQMGTLGKALGSFGAYIAGPHRLKEFLVNRSRAFIFTTALPPAVVTASRVAVALLRTSHELQDKLWENIRSFGRQRDSAIVPIILGNEERALAASSALRDHGLFVQAIRPPTVPAGTSRLRITLSAAHRPEDVSALAHALQIFDTQSSFV